MRSVRIGLANPSQILAHAEVFARSFVARSRCAVYAVRRARRSFTLCCLRRSSVAHAGLFMLDARSSYHVRKLLDCRC